MTELLGRFFRWIIRLIGVQTLVSLLLLSLTFLSIEQGLIAVVGHIHPEWLASTVVYGILVGWLLGRTRLPGWAYGLVALGIGIIWLVLTVGAMSGPLGEVLVALVSIIKMLILRQPPDFGTLQGAWTLFMQILGGFISRLILWFQNAGTSTLIIDPGITSLIWGLILWLVAIWAAWWVRHKRALVVGLLPATTLLVYNVYYTNSRSGIIWLILTGGGWIILQALDSYLNAHRRWQEHQMGQAEIELTMFGTVILLAAALMLVSGLLPSISIKQISDTFQHIFQSQQDRNLAESLGLQQTPVVIPEQQVSGIGLSDIHTVGPGPQLSQEVMMYVTVDGYQPPPPPDVMLQIHVNLIQQNVRYYWRSQTYDSYNGHVWIANIALTRAMTANAPYHPDLTSLPQNEQLVHQHVERLQPMNGALFVTGDLLSANQLSTAAWRASGDLVDARTNANAYTAVSSIQSVTVDQLRSAGTKYPDALHGYLNLPDELPERVRDLAVRLTFNQPTPYDQVMAIQDYLRQFPYSLQVPGSPTDRDVADYFLFDLQKGYCDYFATTMAVMVRAVGIPARLVTGFSTGTYDYNSNQFVVVQANAHSWVEVYFPKIGWVEFEPTTNLPPFLRPGETVNQNKPSVGIPNPVPGMAPGAFQINLMLLRRPLLVLEFILMGLAILLLSWQLLPVESWFLHLLPVDKAIKTIHHRLYRLGRAWGVKPDAARTPHEFADSFSKKLARFTTKPRLAQAAVSLLADLNRLTDLYTRLLFSSHPPTPEEHHQAVQNYAHIRKNLRMISRS